MPHTVTAWRWSCDVAKQKDPKNKGKIVGARELRGIQDDGRFERSLTLPKGVDSDQLKASYQHGVLELTMAASPQLAGRKIPIEIGMEEKKATRTPSCIVSTYGPSAAPMALRRRLPTRQMRKPENRAFPALRTVSAVTLRKTRGQHA
jgi:hypothetical protein